MNAERTAWVFPGQGSQEPGMGRDLYEVSPEARDLFDRADDALGRNLSRLCFEGPADELNDTANAQPAIYITSLACLAAARAWGSLTDAPKLVAGHSLGEFTALAAVDSIEFEAGLRLVDTRGRLTSRAAQEAPGRMAALLGLNESDAAVVCTETGAEICNINAPGQIVIGGSVTVVDRACAVALERGAKRAIPLDVSGAFHTSLMEPAVAPMKDAVRAADLRDPRVPIVLNDRASALADATTIADELVFQLTHPVRWVQCVEYMAEGGISTFIEIGPGRVLSGLIKRIVPGAGTRNISGASAVRA